MKSFSFLRPISLISLILSSPFILAQTSYEGLVEPIRDVLMGPPISGRVETIETVEGMTVKAGTMILKMESQIESLEVERRQLVLDDTSELDASQYRRDLLKEDLESTQKLFESTASISRDELARKEVEAILSEVEVGRLKKAERREVAELAIAKERLKQYRIVAPFDGIVAEMSVDEGESVQAGQPVLRLVDVSSAYLVLNLPAEVAGELQKGQKVLLNFDRTAEVRKSAEVSFVSPVIDPASGLRKVKMLFVNDSPKVEPGRIGHWVKEGSDHE